VVDAISRLNLNPQIYAYTDSANVLHWLNAYPDKWLIFIANRVMEIQEYLPRRFWHHVRSEDNPVDCVSRGMSAAQLLEHALYWYGPGFIGNILEISVDPTDSELTQLEENL
jgi:hypothetical protein